MVGSRARCFRCFGCGEDGDVIDFASRLEAVSPKETTRFLVWDFIRA
nr:CHC2 zinc finger domain-containing protein [Pseudoflavonifractor phocaeensis]